MSLLRQASLRKLTAGERKSLFKQGLGPFLLELEFWAQAEKVRGHYLWRGPVDRQGKCVTSRRHPSPAARMAWASLLNEYPVGELEPTCGQRLCIRPSHQAVRSGP